MCYKQKKEKEFEEKVIEITKTTSRLLCQNDSVLQQTPDWLSPVDYSTSDVQFQRFRAGTKCL